MILNLPPSALSNSSDTEYKGGLSFAQKDKFVLELNSHSLSNFQLCERRFKFSELDRLTKNQEYYPFKRGSGISKYLSYWYMAKLKEYPRERMDKLEFHLFKKMARSAAFINSTKGEKDGYLIAGRLSEYFRKYRDEPYKIIAVESGFSRIIYEDHENIFIYSGRPDLIVDFGPNFGIGWMDHKSESRESSIAPFNNQFLGYSWALSTLNGMVNYLGIQKDLNRDSYFRRESIGYSFSEIERWKNDTITWFFRIASSLRTNLFVRSWRCEQKYGLCPFYNLCASGSEAEERLKIERDFVQLAQPYKSW